MWFLESIGNTREGFWEMCVFSQASMGVGLEKSEKRAKMVKNRVEKWAKNRLISYRIKRGSGRNFGSGIWSKFGSKLTKFESKSACCASRKLDFGGVFGAFFGEISD